MRASGFVAIATLLLLGSGCSITPKPISERDLEARMLTDFLVIADLAPALQGPLSLDGAFDRALEHNLDVRVDAMRQVLAERELALSTYRMLPALVGNVGWNDRSEYQAASSVSIITGSQSLEPSYSSEKDVLSSDLGLSWNILDFGLSYVRSQQAADKVLLAHEQQRRAAQAIARDVRVAYWRAASAGRLSERTAALQERVAKALENSRASDRRGLAAPLIALSFQRELIGIQAELQQLRRNFSYATIELSNLVNARPDTGFVFSSTPDLREIGATLPEMEHAAMLHRPEVREAAYHERIAAADAKAALLELLPNVNLQISTNYNSNDLLVYNDWISWGAQVSYNLIQVLRLPRTLGKIEADRELQYAQRLATSMAVVSQVHVSKALYDHQREQHALSLAYLDTQTEILERVRAEATTRSATEQALIREEMNQLVAEAKRDLAYAELEGAYADVLVAMGISPTGDAAVQLASAQTSQPAGF